MPSVKLQTLCNSHSWNSADEFVLQLNVERKWTSSVNSEKFGFDGCVDGSSLENPSTLDVSHDDSNADSAVIRNGEIGSQDDSFNLSDDFNAFLALLCFPPNFYCTW